jgi:putative redox protein
MFHVTRFFERHFGRLVTGRDLLLGKPECPWSETLKHDTARMGSLTRDAAAVRIPWLLVHGEADEMVPLQDALDARAAASGRPDLVTLPGVDHRFGGATAAMVAATVRWLGTRVRGASA